jgi:hypothetical protein
LTELIETIEGLDAAAHKRLEVHVLLEARRAEIARNLEAAPPAPRNLSDGTKLAYSDLLEFATQTGFVQREAGQVWNAIAGKQDNRSYSRNSDTRRLAKLVEVDVAVARAFGERAEAEGVHAFSGSVPREVPQLTVAWCQTL